MWLVLGAADAADVKPPRDIIAMLEQVAIVEEKVKVCGRAQPDLSDRLAEARDAWWQHNSQVLSAFAELVRTKNISTVSKRLLAHFRAVQRQLERDLTGAARSGENCEWLLWEMRIGKLDYPDQSGIARPRSQVR